MSWDLIGPNRWRWNTGRTRPAASPAPYVISDTMPLTEQVDGKFYDSKSRFRAVGRSLGLTEVGNEKPRPHPRTLPAPRERMHQRADSVRKAIAQYNNGRRV